MCPALRDSCGRGPLAWRLTAHEWTDERRVEPMTAEVGRRLAGRYRLDEGLSLGNRVEVWRAFDELLARPVGVHLVPTDHDRAKHLVEAAQLAATITDARFLRILDAAEEDGLFYVVREWVAGSSLTDILGAVGQMDPADARFMVAEISEAIAAAHLSGIAHLQLSPNNVIFADNGQIKIAGLGVDAAVTGTTAADPARSVARALGSLLHAALTGKWPDGAAYGLAAAPRADDALATPRQVRAGVPAPLDEVVDRILNEPPRHNGVPLTTPAAIAAALKTQPVPGRGLREFRTDTDLARSTHATAARPAAVGRAGPDSEPPPEWEPGRSVRAARFIVVLLVVAGLALLGWLFASSAFDDDGDKDPSESPSAGETTTSSGSPTVSPDGTLQIAAVRDFDPYGTGEEGQAENRGQIERIFDGSPDTGWSTSLYNDDPISRFKPGVGLVVDVGSVGTVTEVGLTTRSGHTTVQLLYASDAPAIPESFDDYTSAGSAVENDGGTFTLTAEQPIEARYVLIWFTRLPEIQNDEGEPRYQTEVFDVEVRP